MKFKHIKTNKNLLVGCLATFLLLFTACNKKDNSNPDEAKSTFTVSALFGLSGQWSTLGKNSQAALEIASEDINQYFESNGSGYQVKVKFFDTKLDPDTALECLKTSVDQGINVVIGPQSSSELAALKPYSDNHDVLIISNGSTAGSLSLPNDNIFRFCPAGKLECNAMAKKIYDSGVRGLVTVCRNDVGNKDLYESMKNAFTALGGTVYEIAPYDINTTNFSAIISDIKAKISTS